MTDQLGKIPSYFEWLVIASAFLSLLISIFAFLLVIFTRKRASRAEEMVKQIVDTANKMSKDAHIASAAASSAASAAAAAAAAARDSASASASAAAAGQDSASAASNAARATGISADSIKRISELLRREHQILDEGTESSLVPPNPPKNKK